MSDIYQNDQMTSERQAYATYYGGLPRTQGTIHGAQDNNAASQFRL